MGSSFLESVGDEVGDQRNQERRRDKNFGILEEWEEVEWWPSGWAWYGGSGFEERRVKDILLFFLKEMKHYVQK